GKGVFPSLAFGAGLSLFIELFQLLTPRHSDIDDLILNSLGAFIGALLLLPFGKLFRGAPEEKKRETAEQGAGERKQKTK
ncbi:MAG: VanZ family protein, partial [Clostridia bacterium]|nr:VanZ family protein [Clostridia bacterium]